jgi:hypothetical protein
MEVCSNAKILLSKNKERYYLVRQDLHFNREEFSAINLPSAEPKMATLPEQCCTIPPFKSDYQPIGERFKLGEEGLEVYTTGPKDAKTALVAIYGLSRCPAGKT